MVDLGGGEANLVHTPSSGSLPLGVVEPPDVHPRILIHGVVLVELRPMVDPKQLGRGGVRDRVRLGLG